MTEKYSLLPINPQQLTPAQTTLQRMSEKHLDFEIQAVNTIRPPDIEYTKTSQPLVPVDMPLSVIRKHIPTDIDKIVKSSVGAGKPKYMLQSVPLNQRIFQKSYFLQVKRISVNK